jgi:hypothetical protein
VKSDSWISTLRALTASSMASMFQKFVRDFYRLEKDKKEKSGRMELAETTEGGDRRIRIKNLAKALHVIGAGSSNLRPFATPTAWEHISAPKPFPLRKKSLENWRQDLSQDKKLMELMSYATPAWDTDAIIELTFYNIPTREKPNRKKSGAGPSVTVTRVMSISKMMLRNVGP